MFCIQYFYQITRKESALHVNIAALIKPVSDTDHNTKQRK